MKLHVLSDLHIEIAAYDPAQVSADVVVLAGDIGKGAGGIRWARRAFPDKKIVYVPGNHEFYGTQRRETLATMREVAMALNIHLLDEDEVMIEGVRFLGATLWTDFELFGSDSKPWAMQEGQNFLNDFRVIDEESEVQFSPSHAAKLHKQALAWLKKKLDEPFTGKTVVVTHHLPSMLSVADRYQESLLSACFASELDGLFGKMSLWIHGHTHDSVSYEVNGTRVVCNPRGYEMYYSTENGEFDPWSVVKV